MPADILTARRLTREATVTLSVRDDWNVADWSADPAVIWTSLGTEARLERLAVRGSDIDSAVIAVPYSEAGRRDAGSTDTAAQAIPDLVGKYLRAEIAFTDSDTLVWYGYLKGETATFAYQSQPSKVAEDPPVTLASGVLRLDAVGLEWFLGRRQVDDAVVQDASAGSGPTDKLRVSRAMVFNGGDPRPASGTGRGARGNRAAGVKRFRSREVARNSATLTANTTDQVVPLTTDITLNNRVVHLPEDWVGAAPAAPENVPNQSLTLYDGEPVRCVWNGTAWELDFSAAVEWDGGSMVEYLLEEHSPRDSADAVSPMTYRADSGLAALRQYRPRLATDRRSVMDLLRDIASPARGVSFWSETVTPLEDPTLTEPEHRFHFFSLAPNAIPAQFGPAFPANVNQFSIDTTGDPFARPITLGYQTETYYNRIVVRGARVTSTFTLSTTDLSLVEGWTRTAEFGYLRGASDAPDYDLLTASEKQRRNDARRAEDDLQAVYSLFRVADDWDGLTGDGSAGFSREHAFPQYGTSVNPEGDLAQFPPGMVMLAQTRLPAPVGVGDRYLPPLAVLRGPDGRWGLVEAMGDRNTDGNRLASYRLSRGERGLSVRLQSNSGSNHTLAGGSWGATGSHIVTATATTSASVVPADPVVPVTGVVITDPTAGPTPSAPTTVPNDGPGLTLENGQEVHLYYDLGRWHVNPKPEPSQQADAQVDWRFLRMTVTAEGDGWAEAVDESSDLPGRPTQELVIHAGEDYRLDLIAKGTITGLVDGELQTQPARAILRDDREALAGIAARARAWYQEVRRQGAFAFDCMDRHLALGDLVTTLGPDNDAQVLNTAIGSIEYDFREITTSYQTLRPADTPELLAGGEDA